MNRTPLSKTKTAFCVVAAPFVAAGVLLFVGYMLTRDILANE